MKKNAEKELSIPSRRRSLTPGKGGTSGRKTGPGDKGVADRYGVGRENEKREKGLEGKSSLTEGFRSGRAARSRSS